jgi:hypothetical protein
VWTDVSEAGMLSMEPRASSGSFTLRGSRTNERAKHHRTRLMVDGKFVTGWYAGKVWEDDGRCQSFRNSL